jgi:FkbM family methyltransferase
LKPAIDLWERCVTLRKRIKRFLFRHVPGFVGAYPYFGVTVRYPSGAWIIDAACEQGIYEHQNVILISRLMRPGSWYYDVGANLGFLAIPVLHQNPDIRVVSFEPSPSYLPYLSRTAGESTYAERWQVVGHAVGASVGQIEFGVGSVRRFDDMIVNPTYRPKSERTVWAPVTTIDQFWQSAGRPDVSFIKLDTEGAELQGLKGAVACLTACRPHLLVECSEPHLRAFGHTPAEIFDWITSHGYTVVRLPDAIPVRTAGEFQVQVVLAYNFLLFPEGCTEHGSLRAGISGDRDALAELAATGGPGAR